LTISANHLKTIAVPSMLKGDETRKFSFGSGVPDKQRITIAAFAIKVILQMN